LVTWRWRTRQAWSASTTATSKETTRRDKQKTHRGAFRFLSQFRHLIHPFRAFILSSCRFFLKILKRFFFFCSRRLSGVLTPNREQMQITQSINQSIIDKICTAPPAKIWTATLNNVKIYNIKTNRQTPRQRYVVLQNNGSREIVWIIILVSETATEYIKKGFFKV